MSPPVEKAGATASPAPSSSKRVTTRRNPFNHVKHPVLDYRPGTSPERLQAHAEELVDAVCARLARGYLKSKDLDILAGWLARAAWCARQLEQVAS